MDNTVFISYSHDDSEFVQALARDFKAYGVLFWRDERDIDPGDQWPTQVQEALRRCTYVVVVLSPSAIESEWVEREIAIAQTKKKVVIPVLLHACEAPFRLVNVQHVDFCNTAYDQGKYYLAFQRLLSALHIEPSPSSTGLRPIPELNIENIFAIPEENPQRDARMRKLLAQKPSGALRLLARTGFSYLHDEGKNYAAGLGAQLRAGTKVQVLLEDPYCQFAEARICASLAKDRWAKLSPHRVRELLGLYPSNLELRFTENPIYCSLFFTQESVIYDPYHLGRRGSVDRPGNQFLVLEFRKPPEDDRTSSRDYYELFEDYFTFLWEKSQAKTFEQLCDEHPKELAGFR